MIKKIYICSGSHVDIGYTDLVPLVRNRQYDMTQRVVNICQKTQNYPEGLKFKWMFESSWVFDEFLNRGTNKVKETLIELARKNIVEITGFETQILPQVPKLEELICSVNQSVALSKKYGFEVVTANLNDIGGSTWNMPQILSRSGIKNYLLGTGGFRVHMPWSKIPRIFYHKSPDRSKVLFYQLGIDRNLHPENINSLLAQYGYALMYIIKPFKKMLGQRNTSAFNEKIEEKAVIQGECEEILNKLLCRMEKEGYFYDALMLQYAGDNAGPDFALPEIVKKWNETIKEPELIIATPKEFFRYIENKYSRQIPEYSGDITCPWSDHIGTAARETALYRKAGIFLNQAEIADSLSLRKHEKKFNQIIKNMLLYSDHTFGVRMWGSEKAFEKAPTLFASEFKRSRESWRDKAYYAESAENHSRQLQHSLLNNLVNQMKLDGENQFVVFNLCSWDREDVVDFYCPGSGSDPVSVKDLGTGKLLPADTVPTGGYWERVTFKPPSVPGIGYRAFELVRGNNVKRKKLKTTENTLENRYLKVEVSSHTGGIVSIYDKKAERELVDNTSSYHLNQFLYYIVEGISLEPVRAGLCDKIKRKPAKIKKVDFLKPFTGKVRSALRVRTQIENGPAPVIVESEIRLSANSRKIEIINTVLKNPTEKTEEGYFSFPFDMPESTIRVEQAGCIVKIPNEQLSGSATHCSGIQDWVNISSENYNITFSSKEAGLVKLGKINHIQHVTEPAKPVKPYIFSFCFHNNWYTNCTRWQGGPWQFRFALTLNNEKFNPVSTYHEGIGANHPLRACVCNKEYKKTRTAQKNSTKYILSFLKLSPSNLMVSFMKPLTNSNAISLCLFEIAGQSGEGIIDTSNLFMSSYERTDLQGYSIEKRRTIKKAKIIFRYGKHEILRFNLYKYNGNALEN